MNPGASRQRKSPSPRPMCRILFDPLCLCCSYNRQSFESKERERCSSLFLFRPVPLSQLGRSPLGQSRLSVMARSYRVFGFFLFLFLSRCLGLARLYAFVCTRQPHWMGGPREAAVVAATVTAGFVFPRKKKKRLGNMFDRKLFSLSRFPSDCFDSLIGNGLHLLLTSDLRLVAPLRSFISFPIPSIPYSFLL